MKNSLCSMPGCARTVLARGMCSTHYTRWRKHGDPTRVDPGRHTHGMSRKPEYKVWKNMRDRCSKISCKSFPDYGARGIVVCDRWFNNFETFFLDMGPRPSPKHSIDRINNDGNYEPGNCRWATKAQQMSNRRNSRFVILDGTKLTITEAAKLLGRPHTYLYKRIGPDGETLTPSAPMRSRRRELSGADLALARAKLKAGATKAAVEREFGISSRYVAEILNTVRSDVVERPVIRRSEHT